MPQQRKQQHNRTARDLIAALVVFLLLLAAFFVLLSGTRGQADTRGRALLEDAIRRAAVTCYAVEGRYPESLSYLSENYGVRIDFDAYAVRYDVFASNLMPDIAVYRKGGG